MSSKWGNERDRYIVSGDKSEAESKVMCTQGRNNSQSALAIWHFAYRDREKTNTTAQSNKVKPKEIHFKHTNTGKYIYMPVCTHVCVCASHKPWAKLRRLLCCHDNNKHSWTSIWKFHSRSHFHSRCHFHSCSSPSRICTRTPTVFEPLPLSHVRIPPSYPFCLRFPLFVQLAAYVNYLPFFFLAMLSLLRCSPIQLAVAIRTHTHAPTWERAHLVRLCGTAKCIIL